MQGDSHRPALAGRRALCRRAARLDEPAGARQLGSRALVLRHRLELGEQGPQALARRDALAGREIGQLTVDAAVAGGPSVLLDPPARRRGGRSPASWRSASRATSAWTTATTAAASATVVWVSGTRTSSVPKAGFGRSSHHQEAGVSITPAAAPQASASAKASQLGMTGGTPWRGSSSATLGRADAMPVSRPS